MLLAALAAGLLLTGCAYTNPVNGYTYLFGHEYNSFNVEQSLNLSPSNYVGFCFMPMKETDERGVADLVRGLTSQYLINQGYVLVTQEDLLEDTSLIDYTFLVGFEYTESMLFERFDLAIQLYNADRADGYKNKLFWEFSCQKEDFPISRSSLEPVYQDLFTKEPCNWGVYETLFPRRSVPNKIINEYNQRLSAARDRRAQLGKSQEFIIR